MNSPFLESLSAWAGNINWLAALAEFTLKSTLLLVSGICLSRCLVKGTAAQRFRILWLAIVGVPFLLFSSFTGAPRAAPLSYPVNTSTAITAPVSAVENKIPDTPPAAISIPEKPAPPVAAVPAQGPAWTSVLLSLWLAGIVASALLMVVRTLRVRTDSAKWPEQREGRLARLLAEAAKKCELAAPPRLLLSRGWIMPCTWGWRKPAMALPREADRWTDERLFHVIHHELGHIARKDALAHTLSTLALWPLWFHPIAFLAKRQLALLRETACDDWVITRGSADPVSYGSDLLALVKHHLSQSPRRHPVGLAMAQSSSVGMRFRRLMQSGVNRRPASARAIAGLIAGWMILTIAVSMLVSCRAPQAGAENADPAVSLSLSPPADKTRPGAKPVHYTLILFCIPDDGDAAGSLSFLKPFRNQGEPNSPPSIPFAGCPGPTIRTSSLAMPLLLILARRRRASACR